MSRLVNVLLVLGLAGLVCATVVDTVDPHDPVHSADYERAVEEFLSAVDDLKANDRPQALAKLESAARVLPAADLYLAIRYTTGELPINRNPEKAAAHMARVHEAGHGDTAIAMTRLLVKKAEEEGHGVDSMEQGAIYDYLVSLSREQDHEGVLVEAGTWYQSRSTRKSVGRGMLQAAIREFDSNDARVALGEGMLGDEKLERKGQMYFVEACNHGDPRGCRRAAKHFGLEPRRSREALHYMEKLMELEHTEEDNEYFALVQEAFDINEDQKAYNRAMMMQEHYEDFLDREEKAQAEKAAAEAAE